jgi:hypothetical protein
LIEISYHTKAADTSVTYVPVGFNITNNWTIPLVGFSFQEIKWTHNALGRVGV